MNIAVLITCFNRVETTLECLRHLFAVRLPEGLSFDVWLNDDGCTDGTSERVANEFPSVTVIKGSGRDYWCGGMRRVWDEASKHYDYDGYLWLNDDTRLNHDAFSKLLIREDAIVVGAISDRLGNIATYGGYDFSGNFICPSGVVKEVARINGNVVWVPRKVYKCLGNFDIFWTHAIGDGDYSLRARKSGIKVYLTGDYVGACNRNDSIVDWVNPQVPFFRRLKSLYSPLGYAEPYLYFKYCKRHYGIAFAVKTFILQHVRVCLPWIWHRRT